MGHLLIGTEGAGLLIEAHLGDTAGSVPDNRNKANITIRQVTQTFWFPSAYKSYIYTVVY